MAEARWVFLLVGCDLVAKPCHGVFLGLVVDRVSTTRGPAVLGAAVAVSAAVDLDFDVEHLA